MVAWLWRTFEDVRKGWLCRQGKCRKSVHEQVDPQELDSGEWRFTEVDCSDKNCDKTRDIHGYLELEKSGDVMVDVPTPFYSLEGGVEVVVGEHNRSGIFSSRTPRAHC